MLTATDYLYGLVGLAALALIGWVAWKLVWLVVDGVADDIRKSGPALRRWLDGETADKTDKPAETGAKPDKPGGETGKPGKP